MVENNDQIIHIKFENKPEKIKTYNAFGNFDEIYSISENLALITRRFKVDDEIEKTMALLYSDKGLGEFIEFEGDFINGDDDQVYFVFKRGSYGYLFKIENLNLKRIGPSFRISTDDIFENIFYDREHQFILSGADRSILINAKPEVISNLHEVSNAKLIDSKRGIIEITKGDDRFRLTGFPNGNVSKNNRSDVLWVQYPWSIGSDLFLRNEHFPNLKIGVDIRLVNRMQYSLNNKIYYDTHSDQVLIYRTQDSERFPDLLVLNEIQSQEFDYLPENLILWRRIIRHDDGYIELIQGRLINDDTKHFVCIHKLDSNFDLIHTHEHYYDSNFPETTVFDYTEHVLPFLNDTLDDHQTLISLLVSDSFSPINDDTAIICTDPQSLPNVAIINWGDEDYGVDLYSLEDLDLQYLGNVSDDRIALKDRSGNSLVEASISEFGKEDPFIWNMPEGYSVTDVLIETDQGQWAIIRRQGFEGVYFLEMFPEESSPLQMKVTLGNESVVSGDRISIYPAGRFAFRSETFNDPVYFQWRYSNAEWSQRLSASSGSFNISTSEMPVGEGDVEIRGFDFFGKAALETVSKRINIFPIPLQKRPWFPYAVGGFIFALTVSLIIAIIQTFKSRRSAYNLAVLNRTLEDRVRDRTAEIDAQNQELTATNTLLNDTNNKLKETSQALAEASRAAGMAQVASGVLHNVGNVFNSLSVSINVLWNDTSPDFA